MLSYMQTKKKQATTPNIVASTMLAAVASVCTYLKLWSLPLSSPTLHCRKSWATAPHFQCNILLFNLSHNQGKHLPNMVNDSWLCREIYANRKRRIFSMHDNEWLSDVRLSLDLIPFIRNLKMFVDKMPILTSLIPTTVSFGMKSPPLNVREIQGWRPSRISKKGCWLKTTWYRRAVVYYSSDLVTPCKTLFEVFPGVEETIAS